MKRLKLALAVTCSLALLVTQAVAASIAQTLGVQFEPTTAEPFTGPVELWQSVHSLVQPRLLVGPVTSCAVLRAAA